jgi:hypothetical protein
MQRHTVYLYQETALHVSVGTSTQHQERVQLHLQHLVFVRPLLLSAAISWKRFECAVGGVRHPQHTQTGSNSSTIVSILPPAQYWVRSTDHSAPRYNKDTLKIITQYTKPTTVSSNFYTRKGSMKMMVCFKNVKVVNCTLVQALRLSWKSWNRFECAVGGVRHPQHTQTGSN